MNKNIPPTIKRISESICWLQNKQENVSGVATHLWNVTVTSEVTTELLTKQKKGLLEKIKFIFYIGSTWQKGLKHIWNH